MSIHVPSLYLPSPPSPSHLTPALSSTGVRSGGFVDRKPPSVPSLSFPLLEQAGCSNEQPAAMSQAALNVRNAPFNAQSAEKATRPRHTEDKAPLEDAENPNPMSRSDALPRTRLLKLDCTEPFLSMHRGIVDLTPDSAGERGDGVHDTTNEHRETTSPSSDEEMGSSAGSERHRTASEIRADKKKMKRFRLTHNQTRFLMSEFTRQAHPDAMQRERLSKKIPGLTPRQVQVWFQNRRAKLKRLTSNDRERVLKSRALPDDFDTAQVLQSPFDGRPTPEAPFAASSGHNVASNSDPNSLRMVLTDGQQRPSGDEYLISPLSSVSTNGGPFSATSGKDPSSHSQSGKDNTMAGSGSKPQRNGRTLLPFIRPNSFPEACTQPPSFTQGPHPGHGFPQAVAEPLAHSGVGYASRAVDDDSGGRRSGMMDGYDHQHMEEPASTADHPGAEIQRNDAQGHARYQPPPTIPAPKQYGAVEMSSVPPSSRNMPTLQSLPVSDPSEYRGFTYDSPLYGMNAPFPFPQTNASRMGLPASFAPSDTPHAGAYTTLNDRMTQQPILTPLRTKFGNSSSLEYASYL